MYHVPKSLMVHFYTAIVESILTCSITVWTLRCEVSLFPADADPRRGDEVTLECSLLRYTRLPACQQNGLRWVDETGTVLSEGVVKLSRQADCFSRLTVKRQSGNDRTYTCQFANKDNKEEIQAAYTPVFTDPPSDPDPNADHQNFILIGAVIGVVVLLVVFAAVLIKYRKKAKVTEDAQKLAQQHDEPESNLTYVTVSHKTQQESPKGRAKKEEDVTYSTVKSPVKIDDDPSSLYSNVSKPR
uniref:uncharacterized protein n=1 Tax=Semicossyphus pulcher TaxID=241346 RepID=UPI0037E7A9E5